MRGTAPELLEATKQGELDVLVGGFTDESPGIREQKEAGITQPYLIARPLVGVPPGVGDVEDLAGRRVAVSQTGAVAALISLDITKDGLKNLRHAVNDLMDQTPTTVSRDATDPLRDRVAAKLGGLPWVEDAEVRLREEGQVHFGEAFVVPSDDSHLTERIEEALAELRDLDWRVHDLAIMPVRELPGRERDSG